MMFADINIHQISGQKFGLNRVGITANGVGLELWIAMWKLKNSVTGSGLSLCIVCLMVGYLVNGADLIFYIVDHNEKKE